LDILRCLVDIPNEIIPLRESTTTDVLHQQYRIVKSPVKQQQHLTEPSLMINNSYSPSQDTLATYEN
jgi:hypothetical protein